MSRLASAIRRAITRRIRDGSSRRVASRTSPAPPAPSSLRSSRAASTSRLTMRPPGPLPFSAARSMPASSATRQASGDARTGAEAGPRETPSSAGRMSRLAGATSRPVLVSRTSGTGAVPLAALFSALYCRAPTAPFWLASASVSATRIAMTSPTAAAWPSPTRISCKIPDSDASNSTSAFSVSTSASGSPRLTRSPGRLCQRTIVPSSMLSLSLGMRTSIVIGCFSLGTDSRAAHNTRTAAQRRVPPLEKAAPRGFSTRRANPPESPFFQRGTGFWLSLHVLSATQPSFATVYQRRRELRCTATVALRQSLRSPFTAPAAAPAALPRTIDDAPAMDRSAPAPRGDHACRIPCAGRSHIRDTGGPART